MTPNERLEYERLLRKLDFMLDNIKIQSVYVPEMMFLQVPGYILGSVASWVGHKILDLTK